MTDPDRRPFISPLAGAAACALALAVLAAPPAAAQDAGAASGADAATTETPAPEAQAPEAQAPEAQAPGAQAPDAPAQGAPAEDAPADDGGLSLGESAPEEGAPAEGGIGETYVREEFTDWQMRCVRVPEGQVEPCQLYQLLRDASDNPVAEVSMFGLPDGGQASVGATVITPLETLLSEQLTVQVDGGQAKRYPFTWCSAIGCFARIGFTDAEVATFRRGNEAGISIVPVAAPDQRVELTMSLAGFTAGLEAVNANNEAGREAAGE